MAGWMAGWIKGQINSRFCVTLMCKKCSQATRPTSSRRTVVTTNVPFKLCRSSLAQSCTLRQI